MDCQDGKSVTIISDSPGYRRLIYAALSGIAISVLWLSAAMHHILDEQACQLYIQHVNHWWDDIRATTA